MALVRSAVPPMHREGLPFVGVSLAIAAAARHNKWLRRAGLPELVDCDRGLQINDSAAALQTAMSGLGVALGRTSLVERDLAEGRLVRPFGDAQSCELAYYVVHRKETAQTPPIVAFKEWLIDEAGSH